MTEPHKPSFAIDLSEFKRGWRIIVVTLLGLAVSANVAMLYGFGAMVIPLQTEFGWSRGELQPAISFLFVGAVVGAQLFGLLLERYGMKRLTLLSLIGLTLVFASMSLIGRSVLWLYLLCFLLPIFGMGAQHTTWTQLIALWYERNRGLALALMLTGTGLSAAIMPSAVTWANARWGWQGPFLLMAVLPLAVFPLMWCWMKLPGTAQGKSAGSAGAVAGGVAESATAAPLVSDAQSGLSFREGMRAPRFWLLNLALGLAVAGMITMISNAVPLLRDKGLSAVEASQVFGSFGLALISGRVLVGYLVDRLWAPGVAAVAMSLPAFGCLLLLNSGGDQIALLTLGLLLIGIGAGAEFDVAAFLIMRYFGMRHYARLFGVHIGVTTAAASVAPWLFGRLYTATGSYTTMLSICGVGFFVGAVLLLCLGRYPHFGRAPRLAAA